MNIKQRAERLKSDVPAVFMALKDRETPPLAKLCAGLAVAYALSPIDLIPDFIPALGYLDDLLIVPALVALAIKLMPADVWRRSRAASQGLWADGKPKKWYYALPIALSWLLILWLIAKCIWLK